jgi:DNA polymerase-1
VNIAPLDEMFVEIWAIDTEYIAPDGERPVPVCLVGVEIISGRRIKLWADDLVGPPPFRTDRGALFVCFSAAAEMGVFKALGWQYPECVLDLYVEARHIFNGRLIPGGRYNLLNVCAAYGIPGIAGTEKDAWRERIMGGFPFTETERRGIVDYCESDVDPLVTLLERMLPEIRRRWRGVERALFQGRYTARAVTEMNWHGVPIDTETLDAIQGGWPQIKSELIREVNEPFGIYDDDGRWSDARFERYLVKNELSWPRHQATGDLDLQDSAFKAMSQIHPHLAPLKELRATLKKTSVGDFRIGKDGRSRPFINPFGAKTGRNQPRQFIFSPDTWVRHLIKPLPGCAVAYLDWGAQEVGIAAALSGDPVMIEAVESGDPYLGFAKAAGLVAPDAAKHDDCECPTCLVRAACKIAILGTNYGMSTYALAMKTGLHIIEATEMQRRLEETWQVFTVWRKDIVNAAQLALMIESVYGWGIHLDDHTSENSIKNFPMQSNGAEMLRLACCLVAEAGVELLAPVHDAVLIGAPAGDIADAVATTRRCMSEASAEVLGGFVIPRIDAKVVSYPDRFSDARGTAMWERINRLVANQPQRAQKSW